MEWLGWAILLAALAGIPHCVCPYGPLAYFIGYALTVAATYTSGPVVQAFPRACSLGYTGILIVRPVSSRLHARPAGREGPATVVEASLWTRRRGRESFAHSLS